MLIGTLCPIVKIFSSRIYNNLKIMNKVVVIIIFLFKKTLK